MKINVNFLNDDLQFGLRELQKEISFEIATDGVILIAVQDGFFIEKQENKAIIHYEKLNQFFLLSKCFLDDRNAPIFAPNSLCLMADNSRNAVLNQQTAFSLVRIMALTGYDSLQMYTEDTFEVDNEPYFGYLRGRLSKDEIKALDGYCKIFGIELIPCIQTLAHYNGINRYATYDKIIDINDILLVENERTYAFLENIFKTIKQCFSSKKINIGMDEAHNLGLGKYLSAHGYHNKKEIMLRHLVYVAELCKKYNLQPMMWSDMFFKLAFKDYYHFGGEIPKEIKNSIPSNVSLIYWDYYRTDEKAYDDMFRKHLDFDRKIYFAGGAWKWIGFAPDNRYSIASSRSAVNSARRNGVNDFILTLWGDNGADASLFSVLPAIAYFGEAVYGNNEINGAFKSSFKSLSGIEFDDFMKIDLPNRLSDSNSVEERNTSGKYLLYNDILLGIYDTTIEQGYDKRLLESAKSLEQIAKKEFKYNYIFDNLKNLCYLLAEKVELGINLRYAYRIGDKQKLKSLMQKIDIILSFLDKFYNSFSFQWKKENKVFGFDVQDLRIGGLKQRLLSAKNTLNSFINGEIDRIEELEQNLLDYFENEKLYIKRKDCRDNLYNKMCTVNVND